MTKQTKKTIYDRRNQILQHLISEKSLSVEQLSELLKVSIPTIRRDLLVLEEENQIIRYHGGASIMDESTYCPYIPYKNKKEAIAFAASQYIKDGDTIFINTSSTALLILNFLKNKHVTVITNNIKAAFVKRDPNISVILTGGEVRIPKESLVGEFALLNIENIKAHKCFLGCSGINQNLSTSVLQEAAINSKMQENTFGEVFILADSSKIGRQHSFISSDLSKVTHLITDSNADKEYIKHYKEANIKVIEVD